MIFASQPNLILESGVHSSLHENCHQIIYAISSLKIYYPPPYEWGNLALSKSKIIENIRKVINQFPWAMHFTNIDVNEKVNLFSKTIKNVKRNYIPYEAIICGDRDPPWINKDIKELIHEKNQADNSYHQNKNNIFSVYQFELLQSKVNA